MDFLPQVINEYSICYTEKEPQLLAELNRETWTNVMTPRMLSGHMQGRILSMISKMISPKNIIEIGTYTGYSALCLAEGIKENGKLHTLDINEEYTSNIKSNPHERRTGKERTPKIAVSRIAQTVKGNLFIDIPLVLKFKMVTI